VGNWLQPSATLVCTLQGSWGGCAETKAGTLNTRGNRAVGFAEGTAPSSKIARRSSLC
jgi:hypothetical protein